MCRVNPQNNKIRIPASQPDYWVLNGNVSEIRPYRLLIKNCNKVHRSNTVSNFNYNNNKKKFY